MKLVFNEKEYECSIGGNGIVEADRKKEGDGCTPAGKFPLRCVYFRAERVGKIKTGFSPVNSHMVEINSGWCNDPMSDKYNRYVQIPFNGEHENLWRRDDIYNLVVVIGYNDNPPIPEKGSGIFMHVAAPGYASTAGTIGLKQEDLLEILPMLTEKSAIEITREGIKIQDGI